MEVLFMKKKNKNNLPDLYIPNLSEKEVSTVKSEISHFADKRLDRAEKILNESPDLSEKELAIHLAKEDLKKTKKLSFKRLVLKKIIKKLEAK